MTQGFVYVLQSPTGQYKIGKTKNPFDRLRTFSVKLPFEVNYKYLFYCENMHLAEKRFHSHFQHRRSEGEWFKLTLTDLCDFDDDNRLLRVLGEKPQRFTSLNDPQIRIYVTRISANTSGSLLQVSSQTHLQGNNFGLPEDARHPPHQKQQLDIRAIITGVGCLILVIIALSLTIQMFSLLGFRSVQQVIDSASTWVPILALFFVSWLIKIVIEARPSNKEAKTPKKRKRQRYF